MLPFRLVRDILCEYYCYGGTKKAAEGSEEGSEDDSPSLIAGYMDIMTGLQVAGSTPSSTIRGSLIPSIWCVASTLREWELTETVEGGLVKCVMSYARLKAI